MHTASPYLSVLLRAIFLFQYLFQLQLLSLLCMNTQQVRLMSSVPLSAFEKQSIEVLSRHICFSLTSSTSVAWSQQAAVAQLCLCWNLAQCLLVTNKDFVLFSELTCVVQNEAFILHLLVSSDHVPVHTPAHLWHPPLKRLRSRCYAKGRQLKSYLLNGLMKLVKFGLRVSWDCQHWD